MKKIQYTTLILYLILSIGAFFSVYPIYFMFVAATKSSGEIFMNTPPIFFGNYFFKNLDALTNRIPIWTALFNSLKVSIIFTFLNLLLCSFSGYAFAKFEFRGKKLLFTCVLLSMMIPIYSMLIPLYRMMSFANLQNTHIALILPGLAGAFGVFLMRQNFMSIPDALIEAARLDGASEIYIFFRIVMPLMTPSLVALGIYIFMGQWSDFTWPLIILNTENMYTLPVALSVLKGDTRIDYGQIMVGAIFAVLPIIIAFLFSSKYFISGIMGGAVKE